MIKLSQDFIDMHKDRPVPWGVLGYLVYKRTYARPLETGGTEEWYQTVGRCCNGIQEIGGQFSEKELEQLYTYVFNLKCCFAGRSLWQLGTKNVEIFGADSLQNCFHVAVNDPITPFCVTFDMLMKGSGVGFNIQHEHVYEIPRVKYGVHIERVDSNDCDFIVPDNRAGWVKLLGRVLRAYFYKGHNFTYSTNYIRHKGRPIKTFGGVASGPEGLVDGIGKIITVLNGRVHHKLRPIDCLDIMNIIADIVVSGNVRRSAELALGSFDDKLFLGAKDWSRNLLPKWRSMSNNTVICSNSEELPQEFWDGYEGHGEPYGLCNLDLCRTTGRLDESADDSRITGLNPCGEIGLESYEGCNLAETFLPNIHSLDELYTATQLMYKVTKTISCYPFSDARINEVVQRNHRLGNGATGFLQSNWITKSEDLDRAYVALQDLDISYSRKLGVNRSIKLTTVKPSGTVSLLAGVTPGIHPGFAKHYIRRIRFASNDSLVELCMKKGYKVNPLQNSDGSVNLDTMVIDFPIQLPNNTIVANQVTAVDQLKFQEFAQSFWSDNAVSCSVYYKPEELPAIKEHLRSRYTNNIKSVSFFLYTGHNFSQAPYEEITEKEYNEYASKVALITGGVGDIIEGSGIEEIECAGGACPVK